MPLHQYLERIRLIDSLIRKKATGNIEMLAKKLGLSRSHVFNLINEMKKEGFPIEFSKTFNSYYYTEEGRTVNHLFERELTDNDMRLVTGGKSFFKLFFQSNYIRL